MDIKDTPNWLLSLNVEDIEFIKNFILDSGSLKKAAKHYEVSYPTVRLRLDRIIEKIKLYEEKESRPFVSYIKELVIDEEVSLDTAKRIIKKYEEDQ